MTHSRTCSRSSRSNEPYIHSFAQKPLFSPLFRNQIWSCALQVSIECFISYKSWLIIVSLANSVIWGRRMIWTVLYQNFIINFSDKWVGGALRTIGAMPVSYRHWIMKKPIRKWVVSGWSTTTFRCPKKYKRRKCRKPWRIRRHHHLIHPAHSFLMCMLSVLRFALIAFNFVIWDPTAI